MVGWICPAGHRSDSGAFFWHLYLHSTCFHCMSCPPAFLSPFDPFQQLFYWVLPKPFGGSPSHADSQWFCLLSAGGPWANHLISHCLRFLTCTHPTSSQAQENHPEVQRLPLSPNPVSFLNIQIAVHLNISQNIWNTSSLPMILLSLCWTRGLNSRQILQFASLQSKGF